MLKLIVTSPHVLLALKIKLRSALFVLLLSSNAWSPLVPDLGLWDILQSLKIILDGHRAEGVEAGRETESVLLFFKSAGLSSSSFILHIFHFSALGVTGYWLLLN